MTKAALPTESAVPAIATSAEIQQILLKLKRIHFGFDSAKILPASRTELEEAAEQLRKYTDIQLVIEGHADDRGTTEYNMALSERRARVVVDFLTRAGIKRDRLLIVAKGEEQPLDSNSGIRSWAVNRRVDFQLSQGGIQFELEDGTLFDDRGEIISSANGIESGDKQ